MSGSEIPVLNKGFIRLDDSMADDLSVVNSARVSFAVRSDYEIKMGESILKASDSGLIRFLMTNRHGTPFEHNSYRFHVKCPIMVMREWIRHRMASYNEMSGRYTKLAKEFYIPKIEDVRSQVGKPGAYTFVPVEPEVAVAYITRLVDWLEDGWDHYEWSLESGVAKEQARAFLGINIYTQFYWTINARSLMNFLSLRNHPTAMWEIHEYATKIEQVFEEKMPVTAAAFVKNDRVAP